MTRAHVWSGMVLTAVATIGLGPAIVSAAASSPANEQARIPQPFRTWTGYEVPGAPVAVATADFNGDSAPDVAYASNDFSGNMMSVQLNAGDGSMKPATSIPAVPVSNDIAAGDLDGDGDEDVVVVSEGSSRTNSVIDLYRNDGRGKFTRTTATGGHGAQRVALADLSGDGALDLAITNYSSFKTLSVLLGRGNGTFRPEALYTVGTNTTGVVAADLDGDASPDLAVGWFDDTDYQSRLALLVNKGDGRFMAPKNLGLTGDPGRPVLASADFDGDGRLDLVAAGWGTDQHIVLRNRGNLSFTQSVYAAGFTSANLEAADVDDDGRPDVVSATFGNSATGTVSYLRNKGHGSFASVSIDAGAQPTDAVVADFDGDHRPDLAVANRGSGTGGIHLQRADGSFGGPPIYLGIDGELPLDTASADFDGDGAEDIALTQLDLFSSGNDVVAIFKNDGKGAMNMVQVLSTGTDGHAKSVYASDLNGDDAPDLMWTPETFSLGAYRLAVSLNDGDGTFGAVRTYVLASGGTGHVTTGDVDGDGDQDAIVANNRGAVGVRILLNKGDGSFKPDYAVPMGDFQEMAIGVDLDGDGILDIAAVEPQVDGSSRALMVVFGKGGGKFGNPTTYTVGNGPRELAAGDFDGDGYVDLVTANQGGDDISNFTTESTSVLMNAGDGTFAVSTMRAEVVYSYFNEFAVAVGDIDGDGSQDIAVAHPHGQNVGVYYGNGNGTFRPEARYGFHANVTDVNLADYNGDGRLDIGGPNTYNEGGLFPSGGVSVLLNRG